jgi:hypothetical protein
MDADELSTQLLRTQVSRLGAAKRMRANKEIFTGYILREIVREHYCLRGCLLSYTELRSRQALHRGRDLSLALLQYPFGVSCRVVDELQFRIVGAQKLRNECARATVEQDA